MVKLKVQAQHLQPGDIVGSGEIIKSVQIGLYTPKGKCEVKTNSRSCHWGKYTLISVERAEKRKSINEMELEEAIKYKD